MAQHENRGRSGEARDPNRPIDPVTGEKQGLGPRGGHAPDADETADTTGTEQTPEPETDTDAETAE